MASVNLVKLLTNDKKQGVNQTPTNIIIITSSDVCSDKFLSYLTSSNTETIVVNENSTNSKKPSKRTTDTNLLSNIPKSKTKLTCVVCDGPSIGFNFSQISCESCKAFFRRNALKPIEKLRCSKYEDKIKTIRCIVKYNVKPKCRRCRLLKCIQKGMDTSHMFTPEKLEIKKQLIEANKRLRVNRQRLEANKRLKANKQRLEAHKQRLEADEQRVQANKQRLKANKQRLKADKERAEANHLLSFSLFDDPIESTPISDEKPELPPMIPSPSYPPLSQYDWSCLSHIQNAYLSASQSIPSASSMNELELAPDIMLAFMNIIDIQKFTGVKLITFLEDIPEFEQINEHDRLILVKYNLILLFLLRHSLTFDSTHEISYDLDKPDVVSPADEAFARHCNSLHILCYGYQFNLNFISILRVLADLVDKDPIVTQLLMLIMIFSKGILSDDDQEPILNDEQSVFYAQSKYIDLLFRYLMENSSHEIVAIKMVRITEQFLKIQKLSRDFRQHLKNKMSVTDANPLIRSLLQLP